MTQPFIRLGPDRPALPVILSVPHAGRHYRPELLRASRLPLHKLELLEDRHVDALLGPALAAGAAGFVAMAPRAEIDLNRDEREVEPGLIDPPLPAGTLLQSARTRGGLGLIPSRIAGMGAVWSDRIARDELRRRIEEIHRPYHDALEQALEQCRRRFGAAILIDCHSMPPRTAPTPGGLPLVVFGDRHGTSIAPELTDAAAETAQALGFRVQRNDPYAGGYIVARHGRPDRFIHALQVEIDRSAYLSPDLRELGPGAEATARLIASLAETLAERLIGLPLEAAAE